MSLPGTSDGTLRLLALTLPAYLPGLSGLFLIEEPENGIHPRAVETMYQSLSHVYEAQVLLATHSPVILGAVEPDQVLCFAKDESGATDIVRGDQHPALLDWQRDKPGNSLCSGRLGMTSQRKRRDFVALVADKSMEATLRGAAAA